VVEPGIEPGTSWLVVRSSDHQTTRLVSHCEVDDVDESRAMKQAVQRCVGYRYVTSSAPQRVFIFFPTAAGAFILKTLLAANLYSVGDGWKNW
jgi:hypothetical protein